MACGGSGRPRARRAGPEPAGQTGRQTAPAQAAEAAMPGAARDDHGQAGRVWGRKEGDPARRRAPKAKGLKNRSREFAPAEPTARTTNEKVQISRPGAT